MRTLLKLTVAVAVLFGIYSTVFGLPDRISTMLNLNTSVETTDAAAPRGAGGRPGGGGRATTVVTVPLELQPYETILNAIGTATAQSSVDVVSNAAGEVVEVSMSANSYVQAGDVLLRLDSRTEALSLEIAQAQLDQAIETVARYERLRINENSTVTDVTMSESRIAQRLAQANVGLAKIALDDRTVRAPIAGKLGLTDIEIGDRLGVNDAIVTIDNDESLLIAFELPERAIGILTEVSTISASTPTFTGRFFDGEILSFDSRLDSVTRSVTVNARIENENGILWPGMTFAVRMADESDPLPAVPSTAITWSRAGSSVWINVDGAAQQVPVTILFRRDDTVWIDGDVPADALVVTEGAAKLRVGSQLSTPNAGDLPADRPNRRRPDEGLQVGPDSTPSGEPA